MSTRDRHVAGQRPDWLSAKHPDGTSADWRTALPARKTAHAWQAFGLVLAFYVVGAVLATAAVYGIFGAIKFLWGAP